MDNIIEEPQPAYKRSGCITPEEYIKMDDESEERLEYFDGKVFPVNYDTIDGQIVMQGASFKHEDIVANCVREIGNLLKGKNCRIRASNLRTAPKQFKSYLYPDATITCGDVALAKGIFDTLTNPVVVIEVVSKSSEIDDYRRKFLYYKQISSLQEYVLIDSFEKICVDIFRRQPKNQWLNETYSSIEDNLVLQSVDVAISLKDIYENINF